MPRKPERPRRSLLLIAVIVLVGLLLLQRVSYSLRLAVMELRYGSMMIILIVLFIWLLFKMGPRDRS